MLGSLASPEHTFYPSTLSSNKMCFFPGPNWGPICHPTPCLRPLLSPLGPFNQPKQEPESRTPSEMSFPGGLIFQHHRIKNRLDVCPGLSLGDIPQVEVLDLHESCLNRFLVWILPCGGPHHTQPRHQCSRPILKSERAKFEQNILSTEAGLDWEDPRDLLSPETLGRTMTQIQWQQLWSPIHKLRAKP